MSLNVSFEQNRGYFMVITRKPPIHYDELNKIEVQMLKKWKIPGFLPFDISQCDGEVSLRYALKEKKNLSDELKKILGPCKKWFVLYLF